MLVTAITSIGTIGAIPMFLGAIKNEVKISSTQGGLTGPLGNSDAFGAAVAIGDLDGDNVPDVAVGACQDDDGKCIAFLSFRQACSCTVIESVLSFVGGNNRGAVYLLYMYANGTIYNNTCIHVILYATVMSTTTNYYHR